MAPEAECVLSARGISRTFPGVRALADVELHLRAGEIHALMGQNGAGKSTLIKVLTGVCAPDAGRIELDGRRIRPASPLHAQQLGISTVYQEVNLCPNLTVAENIFAGRYPRHPWWRGGGIDWRCVEREARRLLAALQIDIDVKRVLSSYPVAIQQMVAIARATSVAARVLILDEPTSSLDADEVRQLFAVLDRLRRQGMAILFVTHFLEQVYAISDRITVLRNGGFVGEYRTSELSREALIAAMIGGAIAPATPANEPRESSDEVRSAPVLQAQGIARKGQLHATDIAVEAGEVVGIAGLLGSGRTELARLLFGLDAPDSGAILVAGQPAAFHGPADAIARGLALCPEERKTQGLIADLSVRENIVLALQARAGLVPYLSREKQEEIAERFIAALGIKSASVETPVGQLSGGNQQKVLLARWLATQPRVLILDEPTRGIDIAAKQEIMNEIVALARGGMAVLFISAEIEEVVRLADRIVVMRDRRKAGELPGGCGEHAVYEVIARH
ncbi:MAG TPA: sugar ABC transporter ATP-binding protein [Steroidobacteraceae bacterium]|nr:sugar ABC transporter ATP-binding protein [Steroidobacteraceae bacterium]